MNETSETVRRLRDRQLSWSLRNLSVFGLFVLLVSLSRAFTVGWQAVMALQILMYLLVLCTALLGRRLTFSVRAAVLIAVGFILSVTGLLTYGLVGWAFRPCSPVAFWRPCFSAVAAEPSR